MTFLTGFIASALAGTWPVQSLDPVADAVTGAVADLDGDGFADLVTTEPFAVWQGDGTDLRQLQQAGLAERAGWQVQLADVDADGDLDAIYQAGADPVGLVWRENASVPGTMTFGPSRPIVAVNDTHTVLDVDQDGDLDVAGWDTSTQEFRWFENDGRSIGTPHVQWTRASWRQLLAVDIDDDGDPDVIATDWSDVLWAENQGGTFLSPVSLSSPGTIDEIRLKDLDRDGDDDIIVFNGQLQWIENLGAGSWGPIESLASVSRRVFPMALGDVDGDRDHDLIGIENGHLMMWENTSSGPFAGWVILQSGLEASALRMADLDNDKRDEAILWGPGGITVFTSDQGNLDEQYAELPRSLPISGRIRTIDLDGDGRQELIYSRSAGANEVAVREIDGSVRSLFTINSSPRDYASADLDGDGQRDLITFGGDNTVSWWSDAAATPNAMVIALGSPPSGAVGDIEGDGDIDLVLASGQDRFEWYDNDGAAMFTARVTPSASMGSSDHLGVSLFDDDDDGDLDLFSLTDEGSHVALFRTEWKSGDFSKPVQLDNGTSDGACANLVHRDVDGDGTTDILWACDSEIRWSGNELQGRYAPAITLPGNGASSGMAAEDFDRDGWLDLAIADDTGVHLWRGQGAGVFAAERSLLDMANTSSLNAWDADSDGDPDLVIISASGDLLWMQNLDGQLSLSVGPLQAEGLTRIRTTGERAAPWLVRGRGPGDPVCPAALHPRCLSMSGPHPVGRITRPGLTPVSESIPEEVSFQAFDSYSVSMRIDASVGHSHGFGAHDVHPSGSAVWIGNHVQANTDTRIVEHGLWLDLDRGCPVDFTVYARDGTNWRLIAAEQRAVPPGRAYHRTRRMGLDIQAGDELLVGVGMTMDCGATWEQALTDTTNDVVGPFTFLGSAFTENFPTRSPRPIGVGRASNGAIMTE